MELVVETSTTKDLIVETSPFDIAVEANPVGSPVAGPPGPQGVPGPQGNPGPSGSGTGDMLKSVYDTNNDGKVNSAALADAVPWTGVTGKPTFGDAASKSTGTTSGTVAAGDDARITGAAQKANNLSDLTNTATARTNLGLGNSATLNTGAVAGTVAAGNDTRIVGAAQKASNLSDLTSVSTARQNLGAGVANGLATLDATGKVPTSQLPASSLGALAYQGTWNALTNTPAISTASSANKGYYYKVSIAGSTSISGITDWKVGDWIVSNGSTWDKIDNTENVTSVAGKTGVVTLQRTDITDLVAIAASGSGADLASNSVGNSKLALMAAGTIKGNSGAVAAAPSDLTVAQVATMLPAVTGDSGSGGAKGLVPAPAAGDGALEKVLHADGTWKPQLRINVRQTVFSGPVDGNGLPNFLPATSATLSVTSQNVTSAAPLVITAAQGGDMTGTLDHVHAWTSNLTWSALTANTTCYLYVNVSTATVGFTTLAPIYQMGGTPAVTNGQFTFNIGEMKGYMGNGAAAVATPLVFVGEVVTSGTGVTSAIDYAYKGLFIGAWVAIPTIAGVQTINHNIGCGHLTSIVDVTARCVTSDAATGHTAGDRVPRLNIGGANSSLITPTMRRNTAVWYQSQTSVSVMSPTSGAIVAVTAANWNYRVEVQRGW